MGVVVEVAGEDTDVLRRAGGEGEGGEGGGVEAGDVGDVVEVDELEEVAELDLSPRAVDVSAGGDADVLVLVVEVLAPLGDADGGEALEVEAGVVASAEEAVAAEDEDGVEGGDWRTR